MYKSSAKEKKQSSSDSQATSRRAGAFIEESWASLLALLTGVERFPNFFMALPIETLSEIFNWLETEFVLQLSHTSRYFMDRIDKVRYAQGQSFWQSQGFPDRDGFLAARRVNLRTRLMPVLTIAHTFMSASQSDSHAPIKILLIGKNNIRELFESKPPESSRRVSEPLEGLLKGVLDFETANLGPHRLQLWNTLELQRPVFRKNYTRNASVVIFFPKDQNDLTQLHQEWLTHLSQPIITMVVQPEGVELDITALENCQLLKFTRDINTADILNYLKSVDVDSFEMQLADLLQELQGVKNIPSLTLEEQTKQLLPVKIIITLTQLAEQYRYYIKCEGKSLAVTDAKAASGPDGSSPSIADNEKRERGCSIM